MCMCMVLWLARYSDPNIVLKYSKWALERDEEMAVRIFTDQDDSFPLLPEKVLEFLSPFPVATVLYLQHAIHHRATKVRIYVCMEWPKDGFNRACIVCIRMSLSTQNLALITLMKC